MCHYGIAPPVCLQRLGLLGKIRTLYPSQQLCLCVLRRGCTVVLTGSVLCGQAVLEFMRPACLCLLSAGFKGVRHHTWPQSSALMHYVRMREFVPPWCEHLTPRLCLVMVSVPPWCEHLTPRPCLAMFFPNSPQTQ